jgi:hypothetical protein
VAFELLVGASSPLASCRLSSPDLTAPFSGALKSLQNAWKLAKVANLTVDQMFLSVIICIEQLNCDKIRLTI